MNLPASRGYLEIAVSNREMIGLRHAFSWRPLKYTDFTCRRVAAWTGSIDTFTEQIPTPTILVEGGHDEKREIFEQR